MNHRKEGIMMTKEVGEDESVSEEGRLFFVVFMTGFFVNHGMSKKIRLILNKEGNKFYLQAIIPAGDDTFLIHNIESYEENKLAVTIKVIFESGIGELRTTLEPLLKTLIALETTTFSYESEPVLVSNLGLDGFDIDGLKIFEPSALD